MKVSGFEFRVPGFGLLVLGALLVLGIGASAGVRENGAKNIYDVRFESLPSDWENLVTRDPSSWDWNFRAYGATGDLVSDPAIVRDVSQGKAVKGQHPTAIRVSCDEDGWSYLVFCCEPEAAEALATGGDFPLPRMEMYFMEGDTDNQDPPLYWQLYLSGRKFEQYDWLVYDRRWRFLKPYLSTQTRRVSNGFVFRLNVPWAALWDRLPVFSDRRDNFWRLQVIRWADGAGQTWGGGVHEPARAGYIRWPAFTEAQKTEILRRLIEKAWSDFQDESAKTEFTTAASGYQRSGRAGYVRNEPYAVEQIKEEGPRTYVLYNENPEFRPTLDAIVASAKELGKGVAGFTAMAPAARDAFYREASERLFNFRYDVEEAWAKLLREKFTNGGVK